MKDKKVIIVGAGPGGLTSAMLLAHTGYDVTVLEKESVPGGRNATLKKGGYTFDTGPTFLMMKYILDDIFKKVGKKSSDYLTFTRLAPMYRLHFPDTHMDVWDDHEKMKQELKRVFPGNESGVDPFLKKEGKRLEKLTPLLTKDNNSLSSLFGKNMLKALPHLAIGRSLYSVMGDYFTDEFAKLSFTFQSKYLGMSPWECPGGYGIIAYIEHAMGIYHVEGGISKISEAMAKIVEEKGGTITYNSTVKKIITKDKKACGVVLEDGSELSSDHVIINADFAYALSTLFNEGIIPKYSKERLKKKEYSCGTYLMYLGLDKQYNLPHHNIVFAKKYRENVDNVFNGTLTKEDISLYARDTSKTDPTLAPEGKSAFYVLVPVPNTKYGIDWNKESDNYRKYTLDTLRERLGMKNIEDHIEEEIIKTPQDWEKDYNVFYGAVFNLSHKLSQMLYFRPHNRLEGTKNCYIVGGGTHPGSGLPTIYESGRIAAELIQKR